jgi:RND family efflux transporter MFP subunit
MTTPLLRPSRRRPAVAALSGLLLCCALAPLAGCSGGGARSGGADPRADGASPADSAGALAVVVVRPGLDPGDLFTAALEPVVDAPAVARHGGIVRAVRVIEGQRVAAGQVLAQLEDDEQRLDCDRAAALSDQAKAEYERAQKAIAENLISQRELEVARARDQAARADAARARLEYERCTVRAPVAGVVRLSRAERNALVGENEILFRVAETRRLKASLYLPAGLGRRFTAGSAVTLVPVSDPAAAPATGRVRVTNPVADPVTGLVHIEVEVPAGPGMAAGAEVRVAPGPAAGAGRSSAASALGGAVLPRGAYVERDGDRLYVYRVAGGRARRTAVDLGEVGPDGFAVLSGLRPGDAVVAAGQAPPADGAPVRPRVSGPR